MSGCLMALDRPDDDFEAGKARFEARNARLEAGEARLEAGEARFEQRLGSCGSGGNVPAPRSEPVEPRTRAEYYEALRAADGAPGDGGPGDGGSADGGPGSGGPGGSGPGGDKPYGDEPSGDRPDDDEPANGWSADDWSADDCRVAPSRTENSGWDSVDAVDRPPADAIRVSPERRGHVLDGDADGGGGHRHGTGNPGKTEFPSSWNDEKIIDALLDVARRPDHPPRQQEWNDRWVARGTRDEVEVVVVIAPDGRIWSGWPAPGGPGVVKNPKEL